MRHILKCLVHLLLAFSFGLEFLITDFNSSLVYYLKVNKEDRIDIDNLKLKTTNLVSHNISLERDFKMDVLDWLTDGEPKLFRSPTEGNFIIRFYF